jgi:hypothetical protein
MHDPSLSCRFHPLVANLELSGSSKIHFGPVISTSRVRSSLVAKAAFCCSGLSYSVLPSIQIDVVRAVMLIIQPIIILLKKFKDM